MNELRDFFDAERKRVFTPGPFFTQRVIARLNDEGLREPDVWEVVPHSSRSVFVTFLMVAVSMFLLDAWVPQAPQRGPVQAYLSSEMIPGESFLYNESEFPPSEEFLELVIEAGGQK